MKLVWSNGRVDVYRHEREKYQFGGLPLYYAVRPKGVVYMDQNEQSLDPIVRQVVSFPRAAEKQKNIIESHTPTRKRSVESEVIVPALRSMATGAFAAVVTFAAGNMLDWYLTRVKHLESTLLSEMTGLVWVTVALTVGAIIAAIYWIKILPEIDEVVWLVERAIEETPPVQMHDQDALVSDRVIPYRTSNGHNRDLRMPSGVVEVHPASFRLFALAIIHYKVGEKDGWSRDKVLGFLRDNKLGWLSQPQYNALYRFLEVNGLLDSTVPYNRLNARGETFLRGYL